MQELDADKNAEKIKKIMKYQNTNYEYAVILKKIITIFDQNRLNNTLKNKHFS